MPRLPSLNAVRAFESAARLGSFVAAAQELHVTQPAIGRHIKLLEDTLRTPLFERTPRGVVLTEKGKAYYGQVNRALTIIADASVDLTAQAKQRWLRLVAVPGLASRWLRTRLPEFRSQHPELRMTLEPNPSFTTIVGTDSDLGIAFGNPSDFQGKSEVLWRPAIFPVCSPEFFERLSPPPKTPGDLLRLPLLHEDDGTWWGDWFRALGVRAQPSSDMSYVSADHVIELALAGEGIALTNALLVADELASGKLVRAIAKECTLDGYVLLSPAAGLAPQAKVFLKWLKAELRRSGIGLEQDSAVS